MDNFFCFSLQPLLTEDRQECLSYLFEVLNECCLGHVDS